MRLIGGSREADTVVCAELRAPVTVEAHCLDRADADRLVTTMHEQATDTRWQHFLALREEAVEVLVEYFLPALRPVWEAFGADPDTASREDTAYVVDAIHTALECAQSAPLLDYVDWLQQVLASRGVSTGLLLQALATLEDFFAQRLAGEEAEAVIALLTQARGRLEEARELPMDYGGSGPEAWSDPAGFQEALLAGDHRQSSTMYEEGITRSGDLVLTAVHVLQPALYEIGRKWQCNTVSVTQERMATAIAEAVLAQASARHPPVAVSDCCVVLARAPGNHHALGMRIVADAFEMKGWDTVLLKAPASLESLLPLLREKRPQLLGLSVALPLQLVTVRALLRQLRGALAEAMPRVIVGGLAVNQYPEVARSMGGEIVGRNADDLARVMAELQHAA